MADRNRRRSKSEKKDRKEKKPALVLTGKVQMTREGYIFVIVDGEDNDVFVKASKTRGALNGDIVKVSVTREKTQKQRREGVVVEIVERARKPFIGILHIVGEQAWVLMESRTMPYDIVIPLIGTSPVGFKNRVDNYSADIAVHGKFKFFRSLIVAVHIYFFGGETRFQRRI